MTILKFFLIFFVSPKPQVNSLEPRKFPCRQGISLHAGKNFVKKPKKKTVFLHFLSLHALIFDKNISKTSAMHNSDGHALSLEGLLNYISIIVRNHNTTYHYLPQHITHHLPSSTTAYHHLTSSNTAYHQLSSSTMAYHQISSTTYQNISPLTITYHSISPPTIIYHCISAPTTIYHSISPPTIIRHSISAYTILYHSKTPATVIYHSLSSPTFIYHSISAPTII